MLIAEDLLLLLLDDAKGTPPSGVDLRPVLGGALLTELALDGAVRVGEKSGFWSTAKVHAEPGAHPTDPLLAEALGVIAERERGAQDLVGRLGRGLREELSERLAARGVLRRHETKVLGVFPRTTWPAADLAHEQQVRQAIEAVLLQGLTPEPRTAALIALLHACDRVHRTIPHEGLSSREVKARAKRITEGDWAAKAVKDAVDAAMAGTVAAVAAVTAATAASGGGAG